ncbi:hypothetical protein M0R04_16555 [Candidatus Dojkabacteria bacterium]|jgi:hypothetical protein|nr:hypothetical protein [Candidatus Dojkabacteria bacterium]
MEKEYKNLVLGCQNCKKDFIIEPDDFLFYEKIKVPAPTFCPECRLQRRQNFRNESTLYKTTCDMCGDSIITGYPKENNLKIYCNTCWYSDGWDPFGYKKDFNFNESFFNQIKELKSQVPRLSFTNFQNENCPYANYTWYSKNCYLTGSVLYSENIMYSRNVNKSVNCIDCLQIGDSEWCYENIDSNKNYNSQFIFKSDNCIDSYFLVGCSSCKNCFMSSNLRNSNYVFYNKQLTKEEYLKEILNLNLNSYKNILNLIKDFNKIKNETIYKYSNILKSFNSTGNNIISSNNILQSFDVRDSDNVRYGVRVSKTRNSMDINNMGTNCENFYDSINVGFDDSNYKFCTNSWGGCFNIEYCDLCFGSSHCFACIGLRNKQYCILNKQYTKEQYEELIPKIIKHMNDIPYIDSKGRVYKYGEFFPSELSPFAYNETIAQEYFPLTKEQAISQGYRWKDKEVRNYNIDIHTEDIPDDISNIPDDITSKVIECAHKGTCNQQCTEAFKIIPEELAFYKRMNLPIPRLCPNCRHYERLAERNPLKLWHRSCMKPGCTNEFETSYSPDRPEIIYCEKCYQQEVY